MGILRNAIFVLFLCLFSVMCIIFLGPLIFKSPFTALLERQQLLLYGRVARQADGTLMRDATFCPGGLRPATDRFVRKVGRPRLEWAVEVGKLALQASGSLENLMAQIAHEDTWKDVVGTFCSSK